MNFSVPTPKVLLLLGLVLILMTISGCNLLSGEANQPTKPIASITVPANGSTFAVGQEVHIAFSAADVKGVAQVELTIAGQPVRVEVVNPPVNSFAASYNWIPELKGSTLIEVRAFNVEGQASDSAQITVIVLEAASAVPLTATPTLPQVTATPTLVLFTATPTPTALPLPPPSPTPVPVEEETTADEPTVTALVGLNVRTGPGLDYPVIGRLAEGQSAEITGRDQNSGWWQIFYVADDGDLGWVAASSQFSTASNAGNVPVVEAPPLPTAAVPTATPSATPSPLKPTIHSFTADQYNIASGQSVTLSWDLSNAEAAFLRYDGLEEGVVAPGSKKVSPSLDTVYTLVARNQAGETTAQVTIKVGGPTSTPVPIWRDGKVRIVNGQSVDFDQGVVQDSVGSGTDFFWDGAGQKFTPQGGASGALLGIPFDQIRLADCLAATYGQPITVIGIDGSALVTGCYKTNEGRYGKFFVSEWDAAANLTVNWLTWNY